MTNYTKEEYERDKAIVDNAPEGATHVNIYKQGKAFYLAWSEGQNYVFAGNDWFLNAPISEGVVQSINSLKEKIALYEQLQELEKDNEILKDEYDNWFKSWNDLNNSLDSRDLEQQIKGLEWVVRNIVPKYLKPIDIYNRIHQLEKLHKKVSDD